MKTKTTIWTFNDFSVEIFAKEKKRFSFVSDFSFVKRKTSDEFERTGKSRSDSQRFSEKIVRNEIRSKFFSSIVQIDTAVKFLKNPKIQKEKLVKKRNFLQKKGLTDDEIDFAFKLTEEKAAKSENEKKSLFRKLLRDFLVAGFLCYGLKIARRFFFHNSENQIEEMKKNINGLQNAVGEIQKNVRNLEQVVEQVHTGIVTNRSPAAAIEELRKDIERIKAISLSASRFPAPPPPAPQIPAWQIEQAQVNFESRSRIRVFQHCDELVESDLYRRTAIRNFLSLSKDFRYLKDGKSAATEMARLTSF